MAVGVKVSMGPEYINTVNDVLDTLTRVPMPEAAEGWAGNQHTAIVGEAGTEVGITRSALRELVSAGIPGHQTGYGSYRQTREYTQLAPGSVEAQAHRQAINQRALETYQESINAVVRREERNTRDRRNEWERQFQERQGADRERTRAEQESHDIWARDRKEFFVKYPGIVDLAIGEPFRQGGPVFEGVYNSIFSGMQAYSRAELAGKSKKESRKLMEQYMVAEGLKEKGVITQAMNWLGDEQKKVVSAQALTAEAIEEETKRIEEMESTNLSNLAKQTIQIEKLNELKGVDVKQNRNCRSRKSKIRRVD